MLKTSIELKDETAILTLNGNFDVTQLRKFEHVFKEYLNSKIKIIALNLEKLEYIDSSGMGSLIRCSNLAQKKGIQFLCHSLSNEIEEVFQLSRIDQYIKILTNNEFSALA